tara:strand:- start:253 stop:489 length:237 start_codon:yes stop_codon:yes gene_type:complete
MYKMAKHKGIKKCQNCEKTVLRIVTSNPVATAFTRGGPKIIQAISPIKKSLKINIANLLVLFERESLRRIVLFIGVIN